MFSFHTAALKNACLKKDYAKVGQLIDHGQVSRTEIHEQWERALDQGDVGLVDVFLDKQLHAPCRVWEKMLLKPVGVFERWMRKLDQYPDKVPLIENILSLNDALMTQKASFAHLNAMLNTQAYQKSCVKSLPLPLMSLLIQHRTPNSTPWLTVQEEQELRTQVWSWVTPEVFHRTCEDMFDDCAPFLFSPPAPKWARMYCESLTHWLPEVLSWPTEQLERFVHLERPNGQWHLSSEAMEALYEKGPDIFPHYFMLHAEIEKELLLRQVDCSVSPSSLSRKM